MKDKLNPVDRRRVPTPLIVSLAAALTLALPSFASTVPPLWQVIGKLIPVNTRLLPGATALPAAPEAAPDNSNDNVGCGCAEACLLSN